MAAVGCGTSSLLLADEPGIWKGIEKNDSKRKDKKSRPQNTLQPEIMGTRAKFRQLAVGYVQHEYRNPDSTFII